MSLSQGILSLLLLASSIGVVTARKPLYSSISFLLSLLLLAALYLQFSASFIAVMQVLVYAGAILVIFTFVIVLFQDAYQQIQKHPPRSWRIFLLVAALSFGATFAALAHKLMPLFQERAPLPETFGSVETLGRALYVDFFFPFEAVVLLFLVALVGALYLGKKTVSERS